MTWAYLGQKAVSRWASSAGAGADGCGPFGSSWIVADVRSISSV